MATRQSIHCINKRQHHDPHERISAIGGANAVKTRWKASESEGTLATEVGPLAYYVSDGGCTVDLIVAQQLDRKYLKTTAGGYDPNNLLSLWAKDVSFPQSRL